MITPVRYASRLHSTWILLDLLHKSKRGNTTNLNNSFSMENEKELLRWDSNPRHTASYIGRCSTTELPRQLNGWVESRQYKTIHTRHLMIFITTYL